MGIGSNEYCGSTGFDVNFLTVSACCGGNIINPETGRDIPDYKIK